MDLQVCEQALHGTVALRPDTLDHPGKVERTDVPFNKVERFLRAGIHAGAAPVAEAVVQEVRRPVGYDERAGGAVREAEPTPDTQPLGDLDHRSPDQGAHRGASACRLAVSRCPVRRRPRGRLTCFRELRP